MALVGSEAALIAGIKPKTEGWWRTRKLVPAHHVLRLLLARIHAGALALPEDPAFVMAADRLRRIWEHRNTREGAEAWMAIQQNLAAFANYADPLTASTAQARGGSDARRRLR